MQAAEVVEQVIPAGEPERSKLGHIALDPLHLDTLLLRPLPRGLQPRVSEVDSRDLPATLGQIHSVPPRATADVQCTPVRQGIGALQQRLPRLLDVAPLPWSEPQPVYQVKPVHGR